ncbi:MAG: 4Fe-4S dicluster domain-containing protein [Clostridiales bacterium]|nr:4Fe-4S dicluster domain-containing protein [Clostridiales bacterium]
MKFGMLIDLRKCVGCFACTVACKAEHATPTDISYNKVKKYEVGTYPSVKLKHLPMPCMHCDNPSCMEVCPTGATQKQDNGIVTVDANECIGCKACMIACPYESRQFLSEIKPYYEGQERTPFEVYMQKDFQVGTVVKCDGCIDRVREGLEPACVQTCITGARIFGDLDDPNSEISRLIASSGAVPFQRELGTEPSVYYIF